MNENKQTWWRSINTILIAITLTIVISVSATVGNMLEHQAYENEIAQLMKDESIRYDVYVDTLGNKTIGVGHMLTDDEQYTKLTPHQAIELLRYDYNIASKSVLKRYPWASGDVHRVLVNMSFQMGEGRLSKFEQTLLALERSDYDLAAAEMLDSEWARQTPNRASRLAGRIMSLSD